MECGATAPQWNGVCALKPIEHWKFPRGESTRQFVGHGQNVSLGLIVKVLVFYDAKINIICVLFVRGE